MQYQNLWVSNYEKTFEEYKTVYYKDQLKESHNILFCELHLFYLTYIFSESTN